MKIKIRPDDPDMLQEPDWRQMNGWLAEIRDDDHARPASDDHARRAPGGDPQPEAAAEPEVLAEPEAAAEPARAEAPDRDATTERAVIGDELRMPIMWCEMGSCISWRTDHSALGGNVYVATIAGDMDSVAVLQTRLAATVTLSAARAADNTVVVTATKPRRCRIGRLSGDASTWR